MAVTEFCKARNIRPYLMSFEGYGRGVFEGDRFCEPERCEWAVCVKGDQYGCSSGMIRDHYCCTIKACYCASI